MLFFKHVPSPLSVKEKDIGYNERNEGIGLPNLSFLVNPL